jgi:hypothetical protein
MSGTDQKADQAEFAVDPPPGLIAECVYFMEMPRPSTNKRDQIPLLEAGDQLPRSEFERRYAAHPEIRKAELIEGSSTCLLPLGFAITRGHTRGSCPGSATMP